MISGASGSTAFFLQPYEVPWPCLLNGKAKSHCTAQSEELVEMQWSAYDTPDAQAPSEHAATSGIPPHHAELGDLSLLKIHQERG